MSQTPQITEYKEDSAGVAAVFEEVSEEEEDGLINISLPLMLQPVPIVSLNDDSSLGISIPTRLHWFLHSSNVYVFPVKSLGLHVHFSLSQPALPGQPKFSSQTLSGYPQPELQTEIPYFLLGEKHLQ